MAQITIETAALQTMLNDWIADFAPKVRGTQLGTATAEYARLVTPRIDAGVSCLTVLTSHMDKEPSR